jgi:sulfur-oxidizing protein SoxY
MTAADHVQHIGLFTELNPLPEVAVFHLGPHSGLARVATRMRLATSQTLTALAVMNDGSVWQQQVEVIVTLAACIES